MFLQQASYTPSFGGLGLKGIKNQPHSLFDVVDKSHGWVDSTGWTFQGDSSTGRLFFAVGAGGPGTVNFDLFVKTPRQPGARWG